MQILPSSMDLCIQKAHAILTGNSYKSKKIQVSQMRERNGCFTLSYSNEEWGSLQVQKKLFLKFF